MQMRADSGAAAFPREGEAAAAPSRAPPLANVTLITRPLERERERFLRSRV